MRYLSLFSGLGGAELAFAPLGWECVAVAEVDPAACAVLKHHYPSVPNLGDITKLTAARIAELGHIDVVIFGFPCQDLSVAGKRAGLKNEKGEATRSGLFFDAMRVVRWSGARYALAENVPGLFSNNDGRDFATVVGEMGGVRIDVPNGGWANSGFLVGPESFVEWAVLDAQYWRIPQRRRRVFIIRDTGNWQSRAPILLDLYSLQGNSAPSREKGQGLTSSFTPSSHGGYRDGVGTVRSHGGDIGGGQRDDSLWPADCSATLDAQFGSKYGQNNQHISGGATFFVPCAHLPSSEDGRSDDRQLCNHGRFP